MKHPVASASAVAILCALALGACDTTTEPSPDSTAPGEVSGAAALHHAPDHLGALLERAWGGDQMWEMLKPRPPGIGTPRSKTVPLYVVAPLDPADPLSPPIHVPGLVTLGGRDHVVPTRRGNTGGFRGVARTVALQHPGWFVPPFAPGVDPCAAPPHDDRIGWAWVPVEGAGGHPCGRVAFVYAVQLAGEACPTPLSSIERVEAAINQGLVEAFEPDEGAWPFTLRPITRPGAGSPPVPAPSGCVPGGERVDA